MPEKLESKVVVIPNAGQFLVEYVENDSQDYAHKPILGFKADIQKRPTEKPDEPGIWEQSVKDYIKQKLGLDEPDSQYKRTKIGFRTEPEKPQRYDIKITPLNHIVLPTEPQQL